MSKRCAILVTYAAQTYDGTTYARFSSEGEAHNFAKTCHWAEIRRTGIEENGAGVIGQYSKGAPTPEFRLASMLKERATAKS